MFDFHAVLSFRFPTHYLIIVSVTCTQYHYPPYNRFSQKVLIFTNKKPVAVKQHLLWDYVYMKHEFHEMAE